MDTATLPPTTPPPPPPPSRTRRRRPYRPPPPTPPSGATRAAFVVVGGAITAFLLVTFTLGAMNTIAVHTDTAEVAWDQPVRTVRIETGGGSVDVRGTETTGVRGTRQIERGLQTPTVTEQVDGDTLVLTTRCSGLAIPWCSASYALDVPRSVRLDVRTGTGRVTVRGTTGGLTASTGTGHIEAWDLDGPLVVETGVGGVEARDLRSEQVQASTGTGSALVSFTTPPRSVSIESGTGDIDVLVPRDGAAYHVEDDGGAGDTTIDVPTDPTADRVIRLSHGAGDARVGQRG